MLHLSGQTSDLANSSLEPCQAKAESCVAEYNTERVPHSRASWAEDLAVFLQEFLDVLGWPLQKVDDLWPEDPVTRRQEKVARLSKALQQGHRALVHRRLVIERLRQRIQQHEKEILNLLKDPAAPISTGGRVGVFYCSLELEEARERLDRKRRMLQGQEGTYRFLLARLARIQRKLGSLTIGGRGQSS
jgi:hypothetical protein